MSRRFGMRRSLIVVAALALSASGAAAQVGPLADRFSIGGGVGVTGTPAASGKAYHVAVSAPVRNFPEGVHLRVELFYQTGTAHGTPFTCERVTGFYCLGRTDENRVAGVAAFFRMETRWIGMWRFYFDPIGAGLYHRRTRSTELQGPTGICLSDEQIISCPNNPDWATFSYRRSRTSLGANTGLGFEFEFARMRLFGEARSHLFFESGLGFSPGAVPVTFGIKF
jgi:hypothetical protein